MKINGRQATRSFHLILPGKWQSTLQTLLFALLGLGVIGWTVDGTKFNLLELINGRAAMADFITRMFPLDFTNTGSYLMGMYETIEIAILGTVIGIVISFPLGILAAKNISPHPLIYHCSRFILNAFRAINEMIFALIFVSAVGLGAFPGVLALAVHSAGKLGKFYAEAIENIDPGPLEALESTGAGKWKTIRYAIIPQIVPEFVTYSLYQWESNVRSATILGLVGAGGIGLELVATMRLFQYQSTSTILLIILITVILVDAISSKIRAKIL